MALELLTEFGQQVTFTDNATYNEDEVDGSLTAGTEVESTPYGVLIEYSDDQVDGTTIKRGDRMLISDNSYAPKVNSIVTIGGEDWSIQSVETVKPAATALIYISQVRQ